MASLVPSAKSVIGGADYGSIVADTNAVLLIADSINSGNFSTLRVADGSGSGYQVPTGKTLHLYVYLHRSLSPNRGVTYLGWGDNDVGFNNVSIPTNSVNAISGGALNTGSAVFDITFSALDQLFEVPLNTQIPAGKYPAILNSLVHSGYYYFWGKLF